MSFWVLENRKSGYAKIHLAHCHTCNNGHGPKPGTNGNGSWKGPFSCFNDAFTWAKSARKYVDSCKFCNPKK